MSRGQPARTSGAGEIGNQVLGRLYAARETALAEAGRIRQLDRKLSQVSKQLGENRTKLEQFKLYPPYPPDEPRRAEAIREFNGIAAEVKRLVAEGAVPQNLGLSPLAERASTADAETAVAALGTAQTSVEQQRASLAASVATGGEPAVATESAAAAQELGQSGPGLSRAVSDLLRQLS
ncbi:MAG: hypothetical protein AB7L66_20405 [Gemmatimonadales bacterium]